MAQKNNVNEEVETLKKGLEDSKAKCEEYLNGWKRERADFLNYKKDEMERIGQLVKYSNEELILKIIPILDNIYLATRQNFSSKNLGGQGIAAFDKFFDGVEQIKKQFEDFLSKEGIEPIETIGKQFDPNTMESVGEAEKAYGCPTSVESGKVVEEVQRGYILYGKIIRVAKVKIAK